MRNSLTQKQANFCLKYFECGNASEAAIAVGYGPKSAARNAYHVLHSPLVRARLEELRKKAEGDSVMNILERKQRLSEVARARLTDFMELGKDGSWVNIGEETEKGGAIQEIHSRTEYDENRAHPTVYTSVKLHDPMKAIDLLNKMDKIYSDFPPLPQDNRIVNIFVVDNEAKVLISQVAERTKDLHNGNANNQSLQGNSEGMGRG